VHQRSDFGEQKFLKDFTVLAKNGKNIILCWIPSHMGILGNEKADTAAKSALSLPVTRMKLPATGMYPRIGLNHDSAICK